MKDDVSCRLIFSTKVTFKSIVFSTLSFIIIDRGGQMKEINIAKTIITKKKKRHTQDDLAAYMGVSGFCFKNGNRTELSPI